MLELKEDILIVLLYEEKTKSQNEKTRILSDLACNVTYV